MASQVNSRRPPVRSHETEPRFVREIETKGHKIQDPAERLRYLRESLAKKPRLSERWNVARGSAMRNALYEWANTERLRRDPSAPRPDPRAERRRAARSRMLGVLAGASVLAALAGAAAAAFQSGNRAETATAARGGLAPVAEPLPPQPASQGPKKIWLVEPGASHELYSNGLRIDTSYTTDAPRRHFRVFTLAAGMSQQAYDKPVGILFHTTESDVWPLEASYNENLRGSSQRLLRYLRRERTYHYLVDRFGRVYRVVREDAKANHAGTGTWSDAERIYMSLNNAFIGVSFETRWDGGQALPITAAQLTSARSLTDYLRQRYEIAPEMVSAHGLTSLNVRQHLIGHHLDWARGFPFAALALPDQYARVPSNVGVFGFGHDGSIAKQMGEPWPGVAAGERAFASAAEKAGKSVEALRRERERLYDTWLSQQLRDEEAVRTAETTAKAAKAGGG